MTQTDEHTGTELARVAREGRHERITAWIGWRLPEMVGITAPAIAAVTHWPGWWAGTGLTLVWIATAPLVRRRRAHHATRTTNHDIEHDTTTADGALADGATAPRVAVDRKDVG